VDDGGADDNVWTTRCRELPVMWCRWIWAWSTICVQTVPRAGAVGTELRRGWFDEWKRYYVSFCFYSSSGARLERDTDDALVVQSTDIPKCGEDKYFVMLCVFLW
jgi:hypothetical protein